MDIINTEALTKFYGKSRGIIDVSLSVEKGDIFGFIGPNGAGKSTFIRTLLGLISASSGRAEIFGLDSARNKIETLSRIGYLPSEAAFYNGMKVKDIIELSASLRGVDCSKEAKILCERLELDTSRKVDELSLGNRKKVGIVCAMQHRPELYILDEPTSGLDPLMQKEFYTLLSERNTEGATVFVSSHVLSEIGRYCKHAAVIREGRILACDSVERLGHTGVKRVVLRGISQLPDSLEARDVKWEGSGVSFLYDRKPSELVRSLIGIEFEDVNITDPELEEVFMHYYAKEEN